MKILNAGVRAATGPTGLAALLKEFVGDRQGRVFPGMSRNTIQGFHADRKAGRVLYLADPDISAGERTERGKDEVLAFETAEGTLVFHSLRHGFTSALLASGADAKLTQSLSRHGTITLVFDRYGHAAAGRKQAAVELAIPSFLPPAKLKDGNPEQGLPTDTASDGP